MNGFLIDSNVLIDIATSDPRWQKWSEEQLRAAAAQGPLFINPIIYAELAPAFQSMVELDRWLDPLVLRRLPLPYAAGWIAAQPRIQLRLPSEMHSRERSVVKFGADVVRILANRSRLDLSALQNVTLGQLAARCNLKRPASIFG
jgi:hypothetical protein